MNYLFVDTETKNLLSDPFLSFEKIESMPSIRQIAWLIYSETEQLLEERNVYVNDDEESKDIKPALNSFNDDLIKYKPIVVGHNINFDRNIIGAEYLRQKRYNPLLDYPFICTMKQTIDFCHLENFKFPRLQELYKLLFGSEFNGAHDAYNDVQATAKCFFTLRNMINFSPQKDPVTNYPNYSRYIEELRTDRKLAHYRGSALLEVLRLFRFMDSCNTIKDEIDFMYRNFLNKDLNPIPKDDSSINELQKKFYIHYESELIEFFQLETVISDFKKDTGKLGIEPLIGTSLYFYCRLQGSHENNEDKLGLVDAFIQYLLLYEIWILKNEKGESPDSSPGSFTFNDLIIKELSKDIKDIDPDFTLTLLMGMFPCLVNEDAPFIESSFAKDIELLENTIKMLKPLISELILQMNYLYFLTELEKHSPQQYKNRITDLRLIIMDDKPKKKRWWS